MEVDKLKRSPILLGLFWILLAILLLISQLRNQPQIEISWETESEINTAGFYILRSDSPVGPFVRMNENIIPGADDPIAGGVYQFTDTDVQLDKVYYYRLEDVEYDNSTVLHEIIEAKATGSSSWLILLIFACFIIGISLLVLTIMNERKRLREN